MSNIDFSLIAQRALANAQSIVQRLFPMGKLEGSEWRLGGLDGSKASNKGSLSINVNTGRWQDFATGDGGGDLISLLAARDGLTQVEAAEEIASMCGASAEVKERPKKQTKDFKPNFNPPKDPWNHKHYRHGEPNKTWVYRNAKGERMFYIHRFDIGEGHKEICPQIYGELDGKVGWFWRQAKDNRPMYGLYNLAKCNSTVVVVEGEKCADALAKIAGKKLAVVSWCGGTNAIDKTDWSPLKGRKVIIWPDADKKTYKGSDKLKPLSEQPGYKAAQGISLLALKAGAVDAMVLEFSYDGVPDGWDVADAIESGWDMTKVVGFIKSGIEESKKKEPKRDEMSHDEKIKAKEDQVKKGIDQLPFDALGYNGNHCFYRPHKTQQILSLTQASHNKQNLFFLAELKDWKQAYPSKRSPYWNQDDATSDMFARCQDKGLFDMDNIRGRGAWVDNGRSIFHCGDKLLIDGVLQESLEVSNSKYIYELKNGFTPPSDKPITDEQAQELFDNFNNLRWANPLYGAAALGWCVGAPHCGALEWRPHIWLNGTAGAGKTWIVENVITPLVGDFAVKAVSSTSEAGIRSKLQSDARPVIIDEAEAQDAAGVSRNQKINELQRQASSESEAKILKGTSTGGVAEYSIRSMFCKSSIGILLNQEADESRNTILELRRPERFDEELMALERMNFDQAAKYFGGMTQEFIDGVVARFYRNQTTILNNIKVWTRVLGSHLKSQRYGDQIGTLMGLNFGFVTLRVWSEEEVMEWCRINKPESLMTSNIESDDRRCLDHLMDQTIKIRSAKGGTPYDLGVSDIVNALRFDVDMTGDGWAYISGDNSGLGPTPKECEMALSHCGLRLSDDKQHLYVANSHVYLDKIYKDTQWGRMAWGNSLKQINNASNNGGKAIRIGGTARKCVKIPLPGKLD